MDFQIDLVSNLARVGIDEKFFEVRAVEVLLKDRGRNTVEDVGVVHVVEDVEQSVFVDAVCSVGLGKNIGEVVDALEVSDDVDEEYHLVFPVADELELGVDVSVEFGDVVVGTGRVVEKSQSIAVIVCTDFGADEHLIDQFGDGRSLAVVLNGREDL